MSIDTIDTTDVHVRPLTAQALKAEQGRRVKNKVRVKAALAKGATKAEARKAKVRGKGFVLPSLSDAEIVAVLAGEEVRKEFRSGRVEIVTLATK